MPRPSVQSAPPPPAPPHVPRLLARLRSLDAPLIQLWTWPGSGEQALLEALLAAEGGAARAIAAADLADAGELRRTVEEAAAAGARWLVAPPSPSPPAAVSDPGRLAPFLPAGLRLVFAAPRRLPPTPVAGAVVTAAEFALTAVETGVLWRAVTGRPPAAGRVRALRRSTGGWYRPLALAAEAAAAGEEVEPEALAELPAVASFLRHEVLAQLADDERPGLGGGGFGGGPPPPLLAEFIRRRGGAAEPTAAAGPDALAFEVALLGAGAVERRAPGRAPEAVRWPLKRAFQVLAYLATSPGMKAGSEELREAVWHDEGEDKVRRNFHPTLSHLRRSLLGGAAARGGPPPLEYHQGVYGLNPELTWKVDAVEFERRCDQGRQRLRADDPGGAAVAWEAAWKRYRGPFLSGADDPWIVARRPRYQRLYLEVLGGLCELYGGRGRLAEAVDALRAALIEDPLQERVALELMRVYARQGRRDLVRRQYERLTALLRTELRVEPLPEVTTEYQRLMA